MSSTYRKLIFFIIDGCTAQNLDEKLSELPGMKAVVENGVKAKYAKPIYPTLSLPNYYSMFSGLYAEEHGMFSNEIYDRDWKEKFHVASSENRDRWYAEAPETLWMKTGGMGIRTCLYWPWFVNFKTQNSTGNNIHHGEDFQTFFRHHDGHRAEFETWIKSKWTQIVNYLKDPLDQFIIIYWGTMDEVSHKFGPRSPEAVAELKLADSALLELQNQLGKAGLLSNVNILVAADHGQMDAPKSNHIHMDAHVGDLVVSGRIEAWCEGEAYLLIYPAAGEEEKVYEEIRNMNIPHISIIRNSDMPERFRVKKARRAPPIWILADPGYSLIDGSNRAMKHSLGTHGYDNECEFMRGICLGRGPGFKSQPPVMTEAPVSTVDYYTIMCKLLGIPDAKVNSVKH